MEHTAKNTTIEYTLTRETTRHQTGFFVVTPVDKPDFEQALARLKLRPMDDFLHQYVLTRMQHLPQTAIQQFLENDETGDDPVFDALAAEYRLLTMGRQALKTQYTAEDLKQMSRHTPLIYLRSALTPDQPLHRQWTALFRGNILIHKPLLPPEKTDLPPLMPENSPTPSPLSAAGKPQITLSELARTTAGQQKPAAPLPTPGKTADTAIERLEQAGVELDQLMRHQASLSPIGLLRTWRFFISVDNHRNRFTLSGEQTSYGRGLSLDVARASLMMEIVERCSAFASVSESGLEGLQRRYPVRHATFSELARKEEVALDPGNLSLETPYRDEPLHWIAGETPGRNNKIWIPVQCLFLFCNLDEPALFSGLGSTGLASGNTQAQARVAAILEIIERHQAATVPYDPNACFRLVAVDSEVGALLTAYHQAGLDLWFQDITPPMGIPCCRCFVAEQNGTIHTGTAAHLNARKAIISAITENTCPFPNVPATRPAPNGLTIVPYENLPDYATTNPDTDLRLLETLLLKNGFSPCYADLTRADINLPVAKAIVPGLEIMGDLDDYSRVHPDLYHNYLAMF
ncbi:MAG: YcaO-like family protein [Thermodesulfobacteriota bacterium]|nr:YcaO-like family protein [Thermodesulfobacteriota bacterium]